MEYALAAIVFKQFRAWPVILGSEPNCFLAPGAMVDTLAKQLGSDPKITAFAPAFAVLKRTTGAVKLGSDPNFPLTSPKQAASPHRKLGSDPHFTGHRLRRPGRVTCGNGSEYDRATGDAATPGRTFNRVSEQIGLYPP